MLDTKWITKYMGAVVDDVVGVVSSVFTGGSVACVVVVVNDMLCFLLVLLHF